MESKKLIPTVLAAPFPIRGGVSIVPSVVFAAGLSMMAGSHPVFAQGIAGYSPNLPPAGELDLDFRCDEGVCPLNLSIGEPGFLSIDDIDPGKYLEFTASGGDSCSSSYPPDLANTVDGVGVIETACGASEAQGITGAPTYNQVLEIAVFDDSANPSSTEMSGIYLFPLTSQDFIFGEGACDSLDEGEVVVYIDGGSPTGDEFITYRANTSTDDDEFPFTCVTTDEQAVLLDFGGTLDVTRIEVKPQSVTDFNNDEEIPSDVFVAGLQLGPVPDVGPVSCSGDGSSNNTDCRIEVGGRLRDQELLAVIQDESIEGNIDVVSGDGLMVPWRVEDPRAHCQPGSTAAPAEMLVFDNVTTFEVTVLDPGSFAITTTTRTLPLEVSTNTGAGSPDYFTISATSCGIPRSSVNGSPVASDSPSYPTATPYIDIVEIASDILPLAAVIGFESQAFNFGPYACRAPGSATLATQPLIEINARDNEGKILQGPVPGVLNPKARDITGDCGSKRGVWRGYSFVAWNLVHHPLTSIRDEVGAEIQELIDSATRYAACVTPSFYYGQLASLPLYIKQYFDAGVYFAEVASNPVFAGFYFDAAVSYIELFRSNLEAAGVKDNFLSCFTSDTASGARFTDIKDTTTPAASDLPLNAWGDLISQLDHLSYGIRTYRTELTTP